MVADLLKPRVDRPAPAPKAAPRAADTMNADTGAPCGDGEHKAGGALLVLLPLLAAGMLLGRKLRG